MIQVYGVAESLGPCARSVPGAGRSDGPAAGAGGPAAAAVGAARPVLQRAGGPQPEAGGLELQTLLPAKVGHFLHYSWIYKQIELNIFFTKRQPEFGGVIRSCT